MARPPRRRPASVVNEARAGLARVREQRPQERGPREATACVTAASRPGSTGPCGTGVRRDDGPVGAAGRSQPDLSNRPSCRCSGRTGRRVRPVCPACARAAAATARSGCRTFGSWPFPNDDFDAEDDPDHPTGAHCPSRGDSHPRAGGVRSASTWNRGVDRWRKARGASRSSTPPAAVAGRRAMQARLIEFRLCSVAFRGPIEQPRSRDREAEGAPLLREYAGKTCIEGSNPSDSASTMRACCPAFLAAAAPVVTERLPGTTHLP